MKTAPSSATHTMYTDGVRHPVLVHSATAACEHDGISLTITEWQKVSDFFAAGPGHSVCPEPPTQDPRRPPMSKIAGYQVHPAAKFFPLMVGAEFAAFCNNVQHSGLLQDVVLWRKGGQDWLLDGRNRLRACKETGIKPTFTHYEGDDPYGFVVSHNLQRRHLGESQRAMVGARLKEVIERQDPPEPAAERKPRPRDQAAQMVSVGGRSIQKAAKVIKHGTPELQASVDAGVVRVDLAAQVAERDPEVQRRLVKEISEHPNKNARAVVRQHDRDVVTASIESEAPMPDGPFRVLLVDFPWAYGKRAGDGTQRGQTPYPTMSAGDIELFAAEKLAPLAHEDSVLWLCVTNAHLVTGAHVAVLKAAGFVGKTMLSWDKERMGTGDWLRGQTEHVIMATKGRPTHKLTNQTTVLPMVSEPRRAHSQKPEALYAFIEDLCPGNRVELFSRTDRPNWISWGAEAGSLESELGL